MAAVQMWPTACVPNGGRQPKGGAMTITGQTPDGKKRQVDLHFAVRQWPTATVRGNTNRHGATAKSGDGLRTTAVNGLHDQANHSTNGKPRESLRLNHRWVAQLMGFPGDWLDDVEWPPSKR